VYTVFKPIKPRQLRKMVEYCEELNQQKAHAIS
jgi:hypothetical protein